MPNDCPETFSWVVPGVLAAMSRPLDTRRAFEFFSDEKINVVVSLTERPLNSALVEEFGLENPHLPIRDFHAPTPQQIDEFVEIVDRAQEPGRKVVVHCLAGRGRTGTMLACYLVSRGRSPDEALRRVRSLRPGSVETSEQEDAVHHYAQRQRKDDRPDVS